MLFVCSISMKRASPLALSCVFSKQPDNDMETSKKAPLYKNVAICVKLEGRTLEENFVFRA